MNADGFGQTNLTRLIYNPAGDYRPSWSPDGSKIAFHRQRQIYTMNSDGSNQINRSNSSSDDKHPSWLP